MQFAYRHTTRQFVTVFERFAGASALPAAAWDLAPSSHAPSTGGAWRDEQQNLLDDVLW